MLTTLTLTGPDDRTKIDDMLALSERFPFVEWAVLMAPSREGTPRFPAAAWRDSFIDAVRGTSVKRAMHLCGRSVKDLAELGSEKLPYRAGYQRLQLNFNAKVWTMASLERLSKKASWAEFWDGTPQGIIVQQNANNAGVPEMFSKTGCKDVQALFDASGGRGLKLEAYPAPLLGMTCGYAGGIGPGSIDDALEMAAAAAGGHDYWLDMESAIRTDNALDMGKVLQVLETVDSWIIAKGAA
jgi:hypothetical protein